MTKKSLFQHPQNISTSSIQHSTPGSNLQKRPISHTYGEAGSFGRTQFCRYDQNSLVDDYIIVSLDVTEASQQVVSQNNLPEESGVVKLVRGHTSDTVLKDIRVLPTVWSRQNAFGEKYTVASQANNLDKGFYSSKKTRDAGTAGKQVGNPNTSVGIGSTTGNPSLSSMGR